MRLFYSWQSDLPNRTNRGLIQTALQRAAKAVASDDSIDVEPVVDRDTSGEPGAPDIAATIFEKITKSDAVVCDVSIVTPSDGFRPAPNPNVLVELGYAVGTLGWNRVVLVANTAYGLVESLPFDLRARRILTYESRERDDDRAGPRRALKQGLEAAIRLIATYPDDDRPRKLTLSYPDIRVKVAAMTVYGRTVGEYQHPSQNTLQVTVQNHSPLPFFLSGISFEVDDGMALFPQGDVLTGAYQKNQRVEPGDAVDLNVDPHRLIEGLEGRTLRRAFATDRIGRKFSGDEEELRVAIAKSLEPVEGAL